MHRRELVSVWVLHDVILWNYLRLLVNLNLFWSSCFLNFINSLQHLDSYRVELNRCVDWFLYVVDAVYGPMSVKKSDSTREHHSCAFDLSAEVVDV